MGCADYGMLNKSSAMATTVRVPRERQFHVVPVPGVFTRGRWKCRDYREDDHTDCRDQILDFTDIREREGDGAGAVEKTSSNGKSAETKIAPSDVPTNDTISSPLKESSTIVVTSIAPAPSTPQHDTHHVEATEQAIRDLERGNPSRAIVAQGALAGGNSSGEDEILTSGSATSLSASNVVAIDNKIEQAMDLVKTHLTFAVREEVEVLRQTIAELEQRVSSLEGENQMLRQYAPPEVLNNISALVLQRKSSANQSFSAQQYSASVIKNPVDVKKNVRENLESHLCHKKNMFAEHCYLTSGDKLRIIVV
ncbi:unnamed protein product [Angiostrongylus costaricensis]|uniref:TSC22 domain family protein 1 n=1 Tax=Angiostrongylus costaricensis TaxID=334426 RepID=A0A0R3PE83_ANGCS|nr:unnamed protein product [Angiostrongylus costaricensis]